MKQKDKTEDLIELLREEIAILKEALCKCLRNSLGRTGIAMECPIHRHEMNPLYNQDKKWEEKIEADIAYRIREICYDNYKLSDKEIIQKILYFCKEEIDKYEKKTKR